MNISAATVTGSPAYAAVIGDACRADPYLDSPFLSLKSLASRTKGAAFERIISGILQDQGHDVQPALSTEYDRLIDGKRVEIKGSFLWGNRGYFRWQQVRAHQDYDYLLFLAFYPKELKVFYAPKDTAIAHLSVQDEDGHYPYNQHGGQTQDSGTYFLQGVPEEFSWLTPLTDTTVFS